MLLEFAASPGGAPMTEHLDHDEHEHHHTESYVDAMNRYRADKDAYFRSGAGSPIPAAERAAFTGLPYFPVDERWIFDDLALEPYTGDEPVHFEIPTTDGRLRPAERAGVFRFELEGAALALTAYRVATSSGEVLDSLFVPFLDATSGRETYGAGRYLDVEPEEDGSWTLDFNLAYHPSCVYDARFSCPLTPAENRLSIRVEAGERLGSEGH
jgi:uncharacterized protein (DUF1684 family)